MIKIGKNDMFMNFWFCKNDVMNCDSSVYGGYTKAIHVRKQVHPEDRDKWKIAYCCAPDNNVLMIQAPSLEYAEEDDLSEEMDEWHLVSG